MTWDTTTDARLRKLWTEGLSTAEIGRRMGTTKNAVIGRAHRLGLPKRQSPIQATGPRDMRAVQERVAKRRERAAELAKQGLPTDQIARQLGIHVTTARDTLREIGLARPPRRPVTPPKPKPKPEPVLHTPGAARAHACRWPIGTPRTPSFRFCEDPAVVPGKPYCLAHCAKAYERPVVAAQGWARVAA